MGVPFAKKKNKFNMRLKNDLIMTAKKQNSALFFVLFSTTFRD